MVRQLFPISLLLLCLASLHAQTVHRIWVQPYKQGLAAQAEETIITFEDVRREMLPLEPRIRAEARTQQEYERKMSDLYREVLQNLIDRVLIVKEFSEKEYRLPQTVVENEYDRIINEDFGGDRERFLAHLRSQGKTPREFRKDLYQRIVVSIMRNEMRKSISEVSPERIRSFYESNKIHFVEEEQVHLRLIMLKPYASESEDLMAQTVEKVQQELQNGTDFAEVAKKYSQDSRSERGGDWGWIRWQDLKEQLSEVAFSLEPGEASEPVKVGQETFILYVEDRRDEGIQPLEEVRERIEEILVAQLTRQAQQAWLERLRRDAFIKYY